MSKFPIKGNVVILGYGSVGKGILPLILKHVDIPKSKIYVVEQLNSHQKNAEKYGVHYLQKEITKENYKKFLGDLLPKESFLVNLSTGISSCDLIRLSNSKESYYIDSCIEPWKGFYLDPKLGFNEVTNAFLRHQALELNKELPNKHTGVLAMGANPGIVSSLAKKAILTIAKDTHHKFDVPRTQEQWAKLAHDLGIKGIQISERDHQIMNQKRKKGFFYNTWSIDGLYSEGMQAAELGWGSHEKWMPEKGKLQPFFDQCSAFIETPGLLTKVRSWAPLAGPFMGSLITHNEAISLSDYFTYKKNNKILSRPTSYYAYCPSNEALISIHELCGRNFVEPTQAVLMEKEISEGIDELGILIFGHKKNAYWYGSHLDIKDARERSADTNATVLQVTSAIIGAMQWVIQNPRQSLVEADQIDHDHMVNFVEPYIKPLVGQYTDWNPTQNVHERQKHLFDMKDVWSFKNFLVRG